MESALEQQLAKDTRTVVNTLLGVGLFQLLIGAIVLIMVVRAQGGIAPVLLVLLKPPTSIGILLVSLSFTARKSPLTASVAGAVSYGSVVAWKIGRAFLATEPAGGIAGLGVRWTDLILLLLLIRSVQAGVRHRDLLRSRSASDVTGHVINETIT